MTKHRNGYSQAFIDAVAAATLPADVAALAELCIRKRISAVEIATRMGVSRQTVYDWFRGVAIPRERRREVIRLLLEEYS